MTAESKRTHELKCWPSFFEAVKRGDKTFEVRFNDRDFAVGDTLVLQWFDPHTGSYFPEDAKESPELTVELTYVLHGGQFGIEKGWCVLGFRLLPEEDE